MTYQVGPNTSSTARSGTFTVAGRTFTVEQLGSVPAGLASAGTLAQVASGGGWKTSFTFVNTGLSPAQMRLSFTSDAGTELTLPLIFPQTGSGPILASTIERAIAAGATLIVASSGCAGRVSAKP